MTGEERSLHLFEGFGIELEYMIADRSTLAVMPISDRVLEAAAGEVLPARLRSQARSGYGSRGDPNPREVTGEVEMGELSWSNELVLHVLELKCNGPSDRLEGLSALFQRDIGRANALLAPHGGALLPTAMHPFMDPDREMKLWPHEYSAVYEAFNRVFDCRGHGWANLQSMHINLPFSGDEEFGRLHAAIRLLLPLMPALAASSPVKDAKITGLMDSRLDVYRTNARKVPSVSGRVIPEPVFTRAEYEEGLLASIYRDIAPHDPEGTLQHEWLNARGAIARFDRDAIEIRVLDIQECPAADLAIAALIVETLRALTKERWSSWAQQKAWPVEPLAEMFVAAVKDAEEAPISDRAYLETLGFPGARTAAPVKAREVWTHLASSVLPAGSEWSEAIRVILERGPLARRIVRALDGDSSIEKLRAVYADLAACAASGRMFG